MTAKTPGFSRRDALKRGALVGGAVLWAAPAVQVLSLAEGSAAWASTPPPAGSAISNLGIVLKILGPVPSSWSSRTEGPWPSAGTVLGLKWDPAGGGSWDKLPAAKENYLGQNKSTLGYTDPTSGFLMWLNTRPVALSANGSNPVIVLADRRYFAAVPFQGQSYAAYTHGGPAHDTIAEYAAGSSLPSSATGTVSTAPSYDTYKFGYPA